MKGKYLITTENWFMAPDGQEYKATWGTVEIVEDNFLGIKTNRNSSNWFAKLGNGNKQIIIAGCQIYYAIQCDSKPNVEGTLMWHLGDTGYQQHIGPNKIYLTE